MKTLIKNGIVLLGKEHTPEQKDIVVERGSR